MDSMKLWENWKALKTAIANSTNDKERFEAMKEFESSTMYKMSSLVDICGTIANQINAK